MPDPKLGLSFAIGRDISRTFEMMLELEKKKSAAEEATRAKCVIYL